MTISYDLAERINAIKFEDLPAEAIPLARTALLDAVGCAFVGAAEDMVKIIEKMPENKTIDKIKNHDKYEDTKTLAKAGV